MKMIDATSLLTPPAKTKSFINQLSIYSIETKKQSISHQEMPSKDIKSISDRFGQIN